MNKLKYAIVVLTGALFLSGCDSSDSDDAPSLSEIRLSPNTEFTITKGTSQAVSAAGIDSDGVSVDLSSKVTWQSSDESIANISAEGLVNGLVEGQVVISASYEGIDSDPLNLTVEPANLIAIQVTPATASIAAGNSQQYLATGYYSDNSTANLNEQATWNSESTNAAVVATLNGRTIATSLIPGTTVISATLDGVSSNETNLTVTDAVLESIQVTPATASIALGTSQQYLATGYYSDNSTANLSEQVTWNSDSTNVAAINDNGLAASLIRGSAVISANLNGINSNPVNLTVRDAVLQSVQVTPATVNLAKGYTTPEFTAMATYTDSSTQNVTDSVQWQSDDSSVVSLSDNVGTALLEGTALISASLDGVNSNEASVSVSAAELLSIQLSPTSASVAKGNTQAYTATGRYSDSSTSNISNDVTWRSDNTAITTISEQGLATAVSVGSVSISANSGALTSNTSFLAVTNAELASIKISAPDDSTPIGSPLEFTASGTYTDGTIVDISDAVAWASTDTTIATITGSGVLNGVNQGDIDITASSNGVTSNTLSIDISAAAIEALTIDTASSNVMLKRSLQLSATGDYTDDSSQNLSSSSSWTSSDASVATVDANGLVTSVSAGSTTITASFEGYADDTTLTIDPLVSVCGAINDTDPTNGEGACIKLVQGTSGTAAGLVFSANPSVSALELMGYSVDGSPSNSGLTYAQGPTYGAFRADGDSWNSDTASSNYGQGGQYDRYCQDLASLNFNGYNNWRRTSEQEFYYLTFSADMTNTYGWANSSYWTSTYGFHDDASADGFLAIDLNNSNSTGRIPGYKYGASCVASPTP